MARLLRRSSSARLRLPLAAALLLGSGRAGAQILPISNYQVAVASASVTGLTCRRREFQMEYTKFVGRQYRYMAGGIFNSNPDPRIFAIGLFGMILMVPVAVLAVPGDLLAAPWRRECDFELRTQGKLVGWAGLKASEAAIAAEGRSLVTPGSEDVAEPVYRLSRSSTTTDAQGRFSLAVPGRVGRSSTFLLGWTVDSRPSGVMSLEQRGSIFILSEPEPEFGSSLDAFSPIEIKPEKKP